MWESPAWGRTAMNFDPWFHDNVPHLDESSVNNTEILQENSCNLEMTFIAFRPQDHHTEVNLVDVTCRSSCSPGYF